MKKIHLFLLAGILIFLLAGCGKTDYDDLDEGWNGLYKTNTNYYIMLYTDNNERLSFNVIKKDWFVTTYPIQWINSVPIKVENSIDYTDEAFGDTENLKIIRDGNKITITASSTDSYSELNNINGTYTKYKNVDSGQITDGFKLN